MPYLPQPQNKPPCLISPEFQKHPRLCAAKLAAGFRECGEAGGVVPSNMEDGAEQSFRPQAIARPLRPPPPRQGEHSQETAPFPWVQPSSTHTDPPASLPFFFPVSSPVTSPRQKVKLLTSLQNNFGHLGLSPRHFQHPNNQVSVLTCTGGIL